MNVIEGLRVAEVAEELDLSEQRVRALISSGSLRAKKVGGHWFVYPDSVERWRSRRNVRGRPLSRNNAWGLLFAASDEEPYWLSPWDRSRLKRRLSGRWQDWVPRVQQRAQLAKYRGHPGQIKRLKADPRLVLSGISAAEHFGVAIVVRDEIEAYLHSGDVEDVVTEYGLLESSHANVILHLVEGRWPFKANQRFAPRAVVALDLIESQDQRSKRAGTKLMTRLVRTRKR